MFRSTVVRGKRQFVRLPMVESLESRELFSASMPSIHAMMHAAVKAVHAKPTFPVLVGSYSGTLTVNDVSQPITCTLARQHGGSFAGTISFDGGQTSIAFSGQVTPSGDVKLTVNGSKLHGRFSGSIDGNGTVAGSGTLFSKAGPISGTVSLHKTGGTTSVS